MATKNLKVSCPDCDGGTVQVTSYPEGGAKNIEDEQCETCNGWGELHAWADLPEDIDRETFKDHMAEAVKPLLFLAQRMMQNPTPADCHRAEGLNKIAGDIVKVRECLLDTYDISWPEYDKKYRESLRKACIAIHGIDPATGEKVVSDGQKKDKTDGN